MDTTARTHLFISYAVEDGSLASWLARKLAAEGYAVWIDRLKMLGGEPWPQDIDVAIKDRTFRMLALLSKDSIRKPNPSKERTLALSIAKTRNIPDFLIPLKIDSVELDWLSSDLNYIPFNRGWAPGWRQLTKKLATLQVPRDPRFRTLAADSFSAGDDLIESSPEEIITNVVPLKAIPTAITAYEIDHTVAKEQRDALETGWAHFPVDHREALAFGSPPDSLAAGIRASKTQFSWKDVATYRGIPTGNVIRNLIEGTIRARLIRAGCRLHPKHPRIFYVPPSVTTDGKLKFTGRSGKKTWRKIEGITRIVRTGKPPEEIHHFFAFEISRWRAAGTSAIQIRPTLVFAEANGALILDDRVGPLRRRLTKTWFNAAWVDRLLAAAQIVILAAPIPGDGIVLDDAVLRITAEKRLNEQPLLEAVSNSGSEGDEQLAEVRLEDETDEEDTADESAG